MIVLRYFLLVVQLGLPDGLGFSEDPNHHVRCEVDDLNLRLVFYFNLDLKNSELKDSFGLPQVHVRCLVVDVGGKHILDAVTGV